MNPSESLRANREYAAPSLAPPVPIADLVDGIQKAGVRRWQQEKHIGNPPLVPDPVKTAIGRVEKVWDAKIMLQFTWSGGAAGWLGEWGVAAAMTNRDIFRRLPYAQSGTSAGSINCAILNLTAQHQGWWEEMAEETKQLQGLVGSWKILKKSGKTIPMELGLASYFREYLDWDGEVELEHRPDAPVATFITVTNGWKEYAYFNECWEQEDGVAAANKLLDCMHGSCSMPVVFAKQQDEYIGPVTDGGKNGMIRQIFHIPFERPEFVIAKQIQRYSEGGVLVNVQPFGDKKPGVYHTVNQVAGSNHHQIDIVCQQWHTHRAPRDVFCFDQAMFERGYGLGEQAADLIDAMSQEEKWEAAPAVQTQHGGDNFISHGVRMVSDIVYHRNGHGTTSH